MKLFIKTLAIVAVVFAILAVLLNILIDNPYTHRMLRAAIDEKLQEHTNLTVEFNAIKVSAVPPTVDLFGLNVAPTNAPTKPLLKAAHARARLSLWAALMGDFQLGIVETTDMILVWPPPWNFPGFLKGQETAESTPETGDIMWPPDWQLPIQQIRMTNAQFFVDSAITDAIPLRPEWVSAAIIGANVDLTVSSWTDINGYLSINNLNVSKNADSLIEEGLLKVAVSLDHQQLTVSSLQLDSQRLNLNGSAIGTFDKDRSSAKPGVFDISKFKRPTAPAKLLNFKLTAAAKYSGDFSVLGTYLGIGDTHGGVSGDLQVNALIPFDEEKPTGFNVTGTGKIEQGFLDGFALYDSQTSFEIDSKRIKFPEFEVLIGDESFGKGSGTLNFDDKITYSFDSALNGLNLIDLLKVFNVDFDVFNTAMTSNKLAIRGQGSPFAMTVKSNALFNAITLPATPYDRSKFPVAPECQIEMNLAVNSRRLAFRQSNGYCFLPNKDKSTNAVAHSPIVIDGTIPFSNDAEMDLQISSPRIRAVLARHFATIPISGAGTLDTSITGPFDKIRIDNKFYFENFTLLEAAIRKLSGSAYFEDGMLQWKNIQTQFGDKQYLKLPKGSLSISEPMTLSTEISGKNIPAKNIQSLVTTFSPSTDLSFGVTKIRGAFQGPLLHPLAMTGQLNLVLHNLSMNGDTLVDRLQADISSGPDGWKSEYLHARTGSLALIASIDHKRAFAFLPEEAAASNEIWTSLGAHPDDEIKVEFRTETWEEADVPDPNTKDPKPGDRNENNKNKDNPNPKRDHLASLPIAGKILSDANLKGLIHLKGQIRGRTDDLQGTFEGSIDEPHIFSAPLAPIQLRGFIKGPKLDMVISHAGNALEGRLSTNLLAEDMPYEWFFRLNRLDLRSLGTKFFYDDPRNYAYLSADWRMKGHFKNWWHSTGELNFKDIRAKFVQNVAGGSGKKALEINQTEPVTLEMTKNAWKFREDRELYLKGRYLGIRLALNNTNPPDNLGLDLTAITDMAILKELVPDIDTATGKVKVSAVVNGPATNPDIKVNVEDLKDNPFIADSWSPVKIGVASVRPPFRNVQLNLKLVEGRLVVENMSASKGGGRISAKGDINLFGDKSEKSRLDINLLDALFITPVAVLKNFETQMSGDLWVTGAEAPYLLSGELNITRSRSTREVDVHKEIIDALQKQSLETVSFAEEPKVKFDFGIKADNSINIHNRNMKGILSADLQIRGDNINPVVIGQIEVNRGTFTYKQDFEITRGVVTFDDPVRPDPALDILAVSDVGSYRVNIIISGRASNPTIEYAVDPPVRENGVPISKLEILVLLSKGDLPAEGRSFADTQSAAASEVANIILGTFEDPVEKIFDLSGGSFIRNVYFDTYPNEDGAPEVRLNMPLDLGEDFDVVIRGNQERREVASVYDLHDNITLSGSVEQAAGEEATTEDEKGPADAAANLRFRFRFE